MKLSTLAFALVASHTVAGHTVFTTVFVNDVNQGDGTCVRMPMTPNNATSPINDLTSNAMACGFDGTKGVGRVCPVAQSSKLSFLFREYPDASEPGALDISHKGPCAVYMKPVTSAINDKATGDGWFKIWEEAYDKTTSQWCTEKVMKNGGFISVTIPSDLASGYYLVRPELLSLHEADKSPPNPQFYAGCAQIFLSSTGTAVPKDTVNIPGYVKISDASMLFNIYEPKWPYTLPGPKVYFNGSPSNKAKAASGATKQSEGLLPEKVVLTNANWWGIELDSYSNEAGCSKAINSCWGQAKLCYDTAPPTGSKNCKIWEAKCTTVNNACDAGNFNGPPDKGKILTPKVKSDDKPAPVMDDPSVASSAAPALEQPKTTSVDKAPAIISSAVPKLTTSTTPSTVLVIPIESSPSSQSTLVPPPSTSISTTATAPISSSVPQIPSGLNISLDATCGLGTGNTCFGSEFGYCCSLHGWCGNSADYCASSKCKMGFGACWSGERKAAGRSKYQG